MSGTDYFLEEGGGGVANSSTETFEKMTVVAASALCEQTPRPTNTGFRNETSVWAISFNSAPSLAVYMNTLTPLRTSLILNVPGPSNGGSNVLVSSPCLLRHWRPG